MSSYLFHKPYGVLSQFTREGDHRTLADFGPFPSDVYAAGRLDADSEGLLLLTSDGTLQHRLTDPAFGHERTYWVQVERIPGAQALHALEAGVRIGDSMTRPSRVKLLEPAPEVHPREVPIRVRKNVPTSWLELTLTEGKNRQVRRMTAAVGHPTLRLIRVRIGTVTIDGLEPGAHRRLLPAELTSLRASLGL